jgi:hypothetical protein
VEKLIAVISICGERLIFVGAAIPPSVLRN